MGLKGNHLLDIGIFFLFALSFCDAKNTTVKVVGLLHCTDCIKNQPSSSNAALGVDVLIICKATKNETKTQGNGAVSKEGKFSVTLSSSIAQDPSSIDGCYARLQSKSGAPCPIRSNQTASVKIVGNAAKTVINKPTIIKFSPVTCQSAIFWPFPNLTFFASPPPPPVEYSPPPPENLDFPPVASPVEPPLPPQEDSPPVPEPSYDPPEPEFGAPSPAPELSSGSPPPAPPPTYEDPIIESPSPPPQVPAPVPVYTDPSPPVQPPPLNRPIRTPTPPKRTPAVSAPPQASPPLNGPLRTPTPPKRTPGLSAPPQASAGMSTPPSRRKPSPIPRAPPIPRLPLTPGAPRKYFNAPKSKSKPPRFS